MNMDSTGSQLVLPMAITRADDTSACVGALTADGRWVRPEPVALAQVADRATSAWRYRRWVAVRLAAPTVADPRPEDRTLLGEPVPGEQWPAGRCRDWAGRFADSTVVTALAGERSLGLVSATLHRVYVKAATRGRLFTRFVFSDRTGTEYDWIVPDVETAGPLLAQARDGSLPAEVADQTRDRLQQGGPLLLTLGLTRPNNRFPGRFRGCHPLVVGVHPAEPALVPAR
jgi:hypothetical protein